MYTKYEKASIDGWCTTSPTTYNLERLSRERIGIKNNIHFKKHDLIVSCDSLTKKNNIMNTDKEKEFTVWEIAGTKSLRKRYRLFKCGENVDGKHLWDLSAPKHIRKTIYSWYGLDSSYKFTNKQKASAILYYECVYCKKVHYRTARICKKCQKAINPLSKKLEQRFLKRPIKCMCKK